MVANFRLPHFETLCVRVQPFKFFASIGEVSGQCLLSMLIYIKQNNKLTEGSKVFFFMMKKNYEFSVSRAREIALKVLQKNAYFAHHEHILLTMLDDSEKEVCAKAIKLILDIRQTASLKENQKSQKDNLCSLLSTARQQHILKCQA